MALRMEVGLSPVDIVFSGYPVPVPQKRGRAFLPNFRPMSIVAKGWMDQDGTWHGGGPWSRPHFARWGTSSAPPKRGQNGWMNQDGTWHGGGALDPAPLPQKGTDALNFRPIFIVAKRQDALRCHLVWR